MSSKGIRRIVSWGMYLSGIIAIFGIVFLILLYIGLFTGRESLFKFGTLNDISVIIQYLLTLPAAIMLHLVFRNDSPRLSRVALWMNVLGVIVVTFFQALLIIGVMSFLEQVGFVVIGVFLIGGWILIVSNLGRTTGLLPLNSRLSILAFFYIGYPVWAYRMGTLLLQNASTEQ